MEIQADRWHGLLDNSKSNVSLAHDNILTKGRCSSVIREYWTHWITLSVLMFAMYFVICMYLEWSYYVKRRENSADWKCQPTKWPKRSARLNEIKHSLTALTTITATDYSIYWLHRMFHTRFLYKHVHAYHHRYNQPNPWNAFAVHPIEIITNALAEIALLFVVPIHWLPYAAVLGYSAYQNIIQHSGIDFKPSWWEIGKPDVMFHDYHHLNSRVNFGSTCYVWDQIHGTMSKSNNQSSKKSKDPSVVDPSSVNK
ncbi:putative methylsterol monooxygenase DDB_G0270946 isoform X2 [Adelges cooleyi]|uniref:putative methylsterol monooxygenase DDB_G0270946 isoform X2 n=1 Tax=Adelges cooleyi TaxID=133065 RepID=UPI00217F8293|nr:putative methylsterol monooxygenase DDB_G0270946 isoform X2 [Adelges cooleyi]